MKCYMVTEHERKTTVLLCVCVGLVLPLKKKKTLHDMMPSTHHREQRMQVVVLSRLSTTLVHVRSGAVPINPKEKEHLQKSPQCFSRPASTTPLAGASKTVDAR